MIGLTLSIIYEKCAIVIENVYFMYENR
jgi:hypothetical protein